MNWALNIEVDTGGDKYVAELFSIDIDNNLLPIWEKCGAFAVIYQFSGNYAVHSETLLINALLRLAAFPEDYDYRLYSTAPVKFAHIYSAGEGPAEQLYHQAMETLAHIIRACRAYPKGKIRITRLEEVFQNAANK